MAKPMGKGCLGGEGLKMDEGEAPDQARTLYILYQFCMLQV